jgi:hypothetical protein
MKKTLSCRTAATCMFALSAGASQTVNAATITETINFTATGFAITAPAVPPINPVTGSFTITFDPTVAVPSFGGTSITLDSINISVVSPQPVVFDYDPTHNGGGTWGVLERVFDPWSLHSLSGNQQLSSSTYQFTRHPNVWVLRLRTGLYC